MTTSNIGKIALISLMLSSVTAKTLIEHQQLDYVEPEKRFGLSTTITSTDGVNNTRAYFKNKTASDYVFVDMNCTSIENVSKCVAVLPAIAKDTKEINYVFLTENDKKEVVKSQTFTVPVMVEKEVPIWKKTKKALDTASDIKDAIKYAKKILNINSEAAEISQQISGFADKIVVQAVELKQKLGVVTGLTSSSSAGTTTASVSSASGATSAGTVAATSTVATSTIVAVAGGAAVVGAASGGGSDGGSSSFSCSAGETTYKGIYSDNSPCNQSGAVIFCTTTDTIRINYKNITDGPASWNGENWSGYLTDDTYIQGTLSENVISGTYSYDENGGTQCTGSYSAPLVN